MQRIASRDRHYERNMEVAYIEELNQAYDRFFGEVHTGSPILTIDTNELNYIANPDDLNWVANRIRQKLKMPPYQEQLPLNIEVAD
jgi:deoxyguanosine kinase